MVLAILLNNVRPNLKTSILERSTRIIFILVEFKVILVIESQQCKSTMSFNCRIGVIHGNQMSLRFSNISQSTHCFALIIQGKSNMLLNKSRTITIKSFRYGAEYINSLCCPTLLSSGPKVLMEPFFVR